MADFGPPDPLTREDLLALLRANFEAHWIEGLLADPSSSSLFEGLISIALRIQTALDSNDEAEIARLLEVFHVDPFVLTAPGKAASTTTVRLSRPSGALVNLTTERFIDQRGAIWRPTTNPTAIPLSGVPQIVDVPLSSERAGEWLNFATPLAFLIYDDLPDPNLIVIAGVDPAINGASPVLDALGAERLIPRNPSENDFDYASRIRFLEDQASPSAIADGVFWILDRYPATQWIADMIARNQLVTVYEPFVDTGQTSKRNLYRTPSAFADMVEGGASPGTYTGPWLPFMTLADDAAGHAMRSFEEFRAWGDVIIPTGTAAEQAAAIAALMDVLDRIRVWGTGIRVIVGEPVTFVRHALPTTLDQAGDWVDQDGAVTDAALVMALEKFDAEASYVTTSLGAGVGDPIAAGDLIFELPAAKAPPTATAVERIEVHARARRVVTGAGTDPVLRFIVGTTSAGVPERVGEEYVVDHDDWRWYVGIFEVNPNTAAALAPGDTDGAFWFGVANHEAVGATEDLEVSELYLVLVQDHG